MSRKKLPPMPAELCYWAPVNKPWPPKAQLLAQNPLCCEDYNLIATTAKISSREEMELLFQAILEARPQFASYTEAEKVKIIHQVKKVMQVHLQQVEHVNTFSLEDWVEYVGEVINGWRAYHQGLMQMVA